MVAWRLSSLHDMPTLAKATCAIIAGGASVYAVYAAILYYEKRKASLRDEGFVEESPKVLEAPERKVLILGLDNAGKSTFLQFLTKSENDKEPPKPTEGFSVMCLQKGQVNLNIWEVGGSKKVQDYWGQFIQDTDLLVFVVDSADQKRLPQAYDALHKLRADERLKKVPIIVLANKQDLPGALGPKEVEKALGLNVVDQKNQTVTVLSLQVPRGKPPHPSIWDAERHIFKLTQKTK